MDMRVRAKTLATATRAFAAEPPGRSNGGAWTIDAATGVAQLSEGARRLLNLPDGEPLSDFVIRLPIDAASRRLVREAIRGCVEHRADFDLRLRFGGGAGPASARLIGSAVGDRDGGVDRVVGVLIDTDDEMKLSDEIATRAAHLSSILETALDGMVVTDERGVIHSFSRAAQRMFGFCEAEAVGQSVSILMAEPDRSQHESHMARYQQTGEPRIIGFGRIVTGRRKDGSQFPLHLSVGEANVEGRRLFTGFMHDLTEVRRSETRTQQLQSELAHISRLSALGEMGSALAHELNQPLAAVANYITGSRRLLADAPGPAAAKIEGALERAAEQVMRAGQIIRRLRDFVSRRAAERRPERLSRLVEEASALGLVGAGENGVALKFQLDGAHDLVFADRVQIEQVLVNLLRNGIDSMEEVDHRRELTVSSRLRAPGQIEIAVSDTGAGIAPDALARLFDPFFTTKAAGLGVGLSISRGIIEAHGGQMWAENNPGGGATFRFTLPLREECAA
jgi:two-component system sensor kinase FixL